MYHHAMEYTTTDHGEIRTVVHRHGGRPAISFMPDKDDERGVLDFLWVENYRSELHEISWKEFFQEFESRSLAFHYWEYPDHLQYVFLDRRRALDGSEIEVPENDPLAEQNAFSSLESDKGLEVHPENEVGRSPE